MYRIRLKNRQARSQVSKPYRYFQGRPARALIRAIDERTWYNCLITKRGLSFRASAVEASRDARAV